MSGKKMSVKQKRIPNSTWIPYGELKKRLNELIRGRKIAVHCESGLRSYKACLNLQHERFQKCEEHRWRRALLVL